MAAAPPWAGMSGGGGGGSPIPIESIAKSVLGGAQGLFGGLANKKAQKEAATNYNAALSNMGQLIAEGGGGKTGMLDVMKALNAGQDPKTMGGLIGALAQHGTDIFGPQKSTAQSQSTSTGTSSFNQKQRVVANAADQPAENMLRANVEGRLQEMNKGYGREIAAANRQAANIGEANRIQERGALARKGLSSLEQPVSPSQRAMQQQILGNEAVLPGVFREKDYAMAKGFLDPRLGSNTSGSSTTTQTLNQLQTMMSPPDYMKLLQFLGMPMSPQAGSAGAGMATLSGIAAGLGKG